MQKIPLLRQKANRELLTIPTILYTFRAKDRNRSKLKILIPISSPYMELW
jgi:hypothetical protein